MLRPRIVLLFGLLIRSIEVDRFVWILNLDLGRKGGRIDSELVYLWQEK